MILLNIVYTIVFISNNDQNSIIGLIKTAMFSGTEEILEQIVELAREHQLMIFSDEIYDRLVMDGEKHISIASLAPDLFCITFSGLSKSHMIAGFRIGWIQSSITIKI